ncbi:bacterial transcriptional activator domain-containing protein [Rugosimonospora africana]|uniref:LysM domain-containing protein n=1 Tax=Rugosimonospora africana TaxID=556532 RepID=A0A8J3R340_9ACTN|nr:bacterial transcriptional activator domain-containing protein [Rugosimonospora africana]GIH21376.1 hypothetical protein Raf01_95480 [Rugosimonospora africana]
MRRLARTVASWWWPAVLLVGLPIGLLHAPGRPEIPHHLPTHHQLATFAAEPLTRPTAITGFILLGWLLWAALACAALAAIYQRLVWWCRWLPRMRLPGPLQSLSAAVLGTIAVSGASTAASAAPPTTHIGLTHTDRTQHPPASSTTPSTPSAASTHTPTPPTATPLSPAAAAAGGSSQPLTYTVHRGDTLWRIAQRQLRDPARWPQIYHLNQSRYDHHGKMEHGDHIEPGWVLTLPQDAIPPHTEPAPPPPKTPAAPAPHPIAPSPTTTAAAPDTITPPAPSHFHAPAAAPTPRRSPDHHPGIHLPDGNWVTVALAASLTAAASMVWLQRRRRYTPRPLTEPADDDPDLKPLPPAITQLRRGLRHRAPDLLPRPSDQPADPAELDDGGAEPLPPIGPSGPQLSGLPNALPAIGLGLTGDGAHAAARALLVATLSAGSPDDPDARGHLITTTDTLTQLLDDHADQMRPMPRLRVTDDLTDALTHVEDLLIERRRLLGDHDADDLASMRDKDPYHPPMPPVLLLTASPPPHLTTRLSNALRLGTSLQISAAILGPWPAGDTLTIDSHGRPTNGDAPRLAILDTSTTVQLLTVLHEAHTGQPVNTDNGPANNPATPNQPAPPDGSPATSPTPVPDHRQSSEPPASPNDGQHHQTRVRIRLLGEPAILNHHNQPVAGLRLHARELLVYLAIHRYGADIPDIMEAFWPTATRRRAAQRLSTETANLRRCIRDAAADPSIKPVINTGGRYHLNPKLLEIDIWRLADALTRATTATEPDDRAAALGKAIATHTATIAEGYEYDWIDQHRYQLTRQGIQARLQLAQLLAPTQPHTAADLIQAAADLDPLDEQVAQHAIQALSAIGDTAGIHVRLDRLRNALNDIDERPSAQTLTLAAQLQHTRPSTDPPPPTSDTPKPAAGRSDPAPAHRDAQEG